MKALMAAGVGAGLASVVVMCIMTPRSAKEWAVGLICTVLASVCGGCAVIQHYGLIHWGQNLVGLIGLIGLIFTCGLPGWAVVRWTFNYIQKNQDKDLKQIVADVKEAL